MMTLAEVYKAMPKDELVAEWRNVSRSIRQEEAAADGLGLRSEIAAANLRTLRERLAVIEKVGKRRRIIK